MSALLIILCLIPIILLIVCATKESKTVAIYKWFGTFGRFRAYLALDMATVGIAMIVTSIIPKTRGMMMENLHWITALLLGLGFLCIGLFIYAFTRAVCPSVLQKRCILDMIIVGLGVTMKIVIFFFFVVWKLTEPRKVVTEDGTEAIVIGDKLYNKYGNCIGDVLPGGDKFTPNNNY